MMLPVRPGPLPSVYVEHAHQITNLITAARVLIDGMELDTLGETMEAHAGLSAVMATLHAQSRSLAANLEALAPQPPE